MLSCVVAATVFSTLYFDDRLNRLFVTFNYQLTLLEMKTEIKDRIMTHDKPVVAAMYNSLYNQVSHQLARRRRHVQLALQPGEAPAR